MDNFAHKTYIHREWIILHIKLIYIGNGWFYMYNLYTYKECMVSHIHLIMLICKRKPNSDVNDSKVTDIWLILSPMSNFFHFSLDVCLLRATVSSVSIFSYGLLV